MIGLIDVDLLDRQTNFPNLALMKLSAWNKLRGGATKLVLTPDDAFACERVFCSKVFTFSKEPAWTSLIDAPIERGGTGYNLLDAPPLPPEVEHCKPDYELYREYAENAKYGSNFLSESARAGYLKASIGFTTRGCFRRCPFCVNRNKTKVEKWSPVSEFLDESRPYIFLLDDNVFGCRDWRSIFDDLEASGKRVSYRQGLDIRLMDSEKARALARLKYYKDVTFAFDNIADRETFERGARIYREHCDKETQAYLLVGYYKSGIDEIRDFTERVAICKRYDIYPFVMKHADGVGDVYAPIFTQAARFYNRRAFSRSGDLLEFISRYGSKASRDLIDRDLALRNAIAEVGI